MCKGTVHKAIFPSTCNATDDKSISRQVAEYMLNATTYLATWQKEEAWFAFPARMTLLHMQFVGNLSCNAMQRNATEIAS